jgi:hypothetical protein
VSSKSEEAHPNGVCVSYEFVFVSKIEARAADSASHCNLGLGFLRFRVFSIKIKPPPLYTRASKPMTIQIEILSLEEKTCQQGTRKRVRLFAKVG